MSTAVLSNIVKLLKKSSSEISFVKILIVIAFMFTQSSTVFAQDTLYVFNVDSCFQNTPAFYTNYGEYVTAYGYDFLKMAAVLQGIVNRDSVGNKIFYMYHGDHPVTPNFNPDQFWLNYLSQPGNYLSGYTKIWINPSTDSFYTDLLSRFKDKIKGVVLWTDSIPATSNVASTICGVDDYLPAVRGGELDSMLVKYLGNLPTIDLASEFAGSYATIPGTNIPTSGSKKCDAYLWAIDKYINTGLVNPTCVVYAVDAWSPLRGQNDQVVYSDSLFWRMLINADYYIANKGFFVDLCPDTRIPNDDPTQPLGTDYQTFQKVLAALRAEADTSIITAGGFVPWHFKYTNGTQADAVHQEWNTVNLFSSYFAQLDALDVGLANASLYQHVPLDPNLKQNNDQGLSRSTYSPDTNYVCFYMGDYDSSPWVSSRLPNLWNSSGRGTIPLAWGLDPDLSTRIPQAFDYYYETATKNDYFVSADNGTGYLNSIELPSQYIPYWVNYAQRLFKQFDLSIAGFVITGYSSSLPQSLETDYTMFATNGVGVNTQGAQLLVNNVPFVTVHDLGTPTPANPTQVEQSLYTLFKGLGTGYVMFVRTVLANPATLASGVALLNKDYPNLHVKVIDPYTAFRYYQPASAIVSPNGAGEIPGAFRLFQNYPNPFNPSTLIKYALPKAQMVTLKIYNVLGQEVATLVDEHQRAGYHEANFNGDHFASGVYFYILRTDNFMSIHKMILLK